MSGPQPVYHTKPGSGSYHSSSSPPPNIPYESYIDTNPIATPPIPHSPPPTSQYPPAGYMNQMNTSPTPPPLQHPAPVAAYPNQTPQAAYSSPPETYQAVQAPYHSPQNSYHSQQPSQSAPPQSPQYFLPQQAQPPQGQVSYATPQYITPPPQTMSPTYQNGSPAPQMQTPQSHGHPEKSSSTVIYVQQQPAPAPAAAHAPAAAAAAAPQNVTRQPKPKADMVIKGNRNVKNIRFQADGTRDWSDDICDCCGHTGNSGTCCLATFCPCIVYGQNKARLEHLSVHDSPDPSGGGSLCSHDCFIHGCLTAVCLFGWALQISGRASVRNRYNIAGSWPGDCCAACLCTPCELAQESREISLEENSFPRGVGLSTGEGYRAPPQTEKPASKKAATTGPKKAAGGAGPKKKKKV